MEYGNYGYSDEMTGAGWQAAHQHGKPTNPAAPLAPERSGRRAQPAANRRRLAHRHHASTKATCCPRSSAIRSSTATPGRASSAPIRSPRTAPATRPRSSTSSAARRPMVPPVRRVRRSGRLAVRRRLVRSGRRRPCPGATPTGAASSASPRPASKYTVPKFDFNTIDGAIEALKNPVPRRPLSGLDGAARCRRQGRAGAAASC